MKKRHPLLPFALLFISSSCLTIPCSAQTTITPTAGFGSGGMITTTGMTGAQTVTIPANAGVQSGANLFHSFSQFDVGQGDTAMFTPTGSTAAINNIIARVYSPGASSINGNVTVSNTGNFAGANLFLINPNGVIFGKNSSVSVPGDFVVSTANYVKLNDGTGVFYSDPTNLLSGTDNLTSAPVSAFGFFKNTTPNGITVDGGASLVAGGSLQFAAGAFTATAGTNLSVSKATLGIFSGAQTSATSDATAPYLTGSVTDYSSAAHFTAYGNVTLGDSMHPTGGASLAASGTGGKVIIRGGQLVQMGTGGTISASGRVAIQGDSFAVSGTVSTQTGSIDIDTTGDVTMTGGTITSQGGSITLGQTSLDNLTLDSASSITETSGSGGTLSINSTGTISNGGSISTAGSTDPLQINALALNLTTGSGVSGSIKTSGAALTLGTSSEPLGGLSLASGTMIAETGGSGGTLGITSSGAINNAGTISTTGTSEAVQISAQSVGLTGTISTQSGNINVDTTGDVTLTGGTITSQGSSITLGQTSLDNLMLDGASSITETAGSGGTLSITASGAITNAGTISTVGSSDSLQISAQSVGLTGTISTQSRALSLNTTGDVTLTGGTISSQGGAITLGQTSLGNLSLNSTSSIDSVGGMVTVISKGDIDLSGGSIESTSTGSANAGGVNVTDASGNITLTSGAEIASISSGSGNAGNVSINNGVTAEDSSKVLTITGDGTQSYDSSTGVDSPNTGIFSLSTGTGGAGAVNVTAIGDVIISAGGQIASVATKTTGGNAQSVTLTLNPDNLFDVNFNSLTVGGVTSTATTTVPIIYSSTANASGTDGAVSINALSSSIKVQAGAAIQTSTQDTPAGNVYVQAGSLTLAPYSAIQSVMSQTNPNDGATTGKTGSVTVIVFNFDPSNFSFIGPLSIANNAFIQTVANPNKSGFNPVGQVTIYAGSLTEGGMSAPTASDGFDYAYKIKGDTQIRMLNSTTLNGANGTDVSSGTGPTVQNLIGYPSNPSGTLPTPTAGNGIILDGTLGGVEGPIVPVYSTPTYTYTIDTADGTVAGGNLFLSFSQFDLGINHPNASNPSQVGPVSETALFDAPGIANILARVTGGQPSQIDGTLAEASGTTANLFFLNPSGLLFTANTSLSLNGALTISTANFVHFGSGGAFFSQINPLADAALTTSPSLFSGPVSAFGFTGATPEPVTIDTATLSNDASGNAQIQVIAGNISLEDDALLNSSQTLLFSAGSPGVLAFKSGNSLATFPSSFTSASQILNDSSFSALGTAAISGGSVITVPSPNIASTILIRANTFSLTDSLIVDQTTAQQGSLGGQVLIDVTGAASITSATNDSFISTSTLGASDGGSVQINAASLTITGGQNNLFTTGILSTAQPANYYTSDSGYIPFTYANPATATGNAGAVTLAIGGPVNVSTFGQISTDTNGLGNAGTININGINGINPQLTVGGGSSITSSTSLGNTAFSQTGNAGTVTVTASSLSITGSPSLIATSAGTALNPAGPTGNGGNIDITVAGQNGGGAGDISISNGGQISASSYNNGEAGTVTITQSGSTDLANPATNPAVIGGLYVNGGSISTAANGTGTATPTNPNAGNILLNTQALTLNGGTITSSTSGLSKGGDITVNGVSGQPTQWVSIEGGAEISSDTGGTNGSGAGGAITIHTGALTVNGTGSAISTSSTDGTGSGGSIGLIVTGNANVAGATGDVVVTDSGAISASSDTVGEAGTVTITQSGSTDLANPATNPAIIGGLHVDGGSISTAANGIGTTTPTNPNAGNIMLNTQALTLDGGGVIFSGTNGLSKGGDITVNGAMSGQPTQFVIVTGGAITSNTAGAGNGGTISIQTGALALNGNGTIAVSANGGTGGGGNIGVTVTGNPNVAGSTGDVTITGGGTIAAVSQTTGEAGTVTITQSGSMDITNPSLNPATNGGLYINGGLILTAASGPGTAIPANPNAGDITLNTQALTLDGGGVIFSGTLGGSKGGDITVNGVTSNQPTQFLIVRGGSEIASTTEGSGNGGTISINTGLLTVDGANSAISTSANSGTGGGGSIGLTVTGNPNGVGSTGDVMVTNGGTISASSDTAGEAGTVTITQSGSLDITDPSLNPATNGGLYLNNGLITTAANGTGTVHPANPNAGNITLNTEALTLTGGSLILSSTSGRSKAGDVTVGGAVFGQPAQFVVIRDGAKIASETEGANGRGAGGTVTIQTGSLLVDDATISTSATGGIGNAGDISIDAVSNDLTQVPFVTLQNGGTIMSESANTGSAGMISIQSNMLTVTGQGSAISTDAGALGNTANSKGEIMITGHDLSIDDSGLVSATTGGLSPGGTITASASNEVSLSMGGRMDASSTAAAGGGNGGSILIGSDPVTAPEDYGVNSPYTLSLLDDSVISCDSQNTNGGNIAIHAGQVILKNNSLVSTSEPNGAANTLGGDITIRAGNLFYLNNYSFIDSNAGQGKGGNIMLDPQYVILNHSGIDAAGGSGNGNVTIDSTYVLSGDSFILATGIVSIDSLPLDLTGSLIPLPANLTSDEKRLRESCARAINHEFSSLIVVGRGGTETAPDELNGDPEASESLPASQEKEKLP